MSVLNRIRDSLQERFSAEQSRWMVAAPFLFATGIAIYFQLPMEPAWWLVLAVFELWLLLFYICRHRGWHLFFLCGILVMSGFINILLRTHYQNRRVETFPKVKVTYLSGKIRDISENSKGKQRLLLEQVSDYEQPLKGYFRITVNNNGKKPAVGQCVEMVATLFPREPLPVLNGYPADRKYFYEELSAVGYADSEIFVIDCTSAAAWYSSFYERLNALRHRIMQGVSEVLPTNQAGVADALLVGEKSRIPQKITENYRNSGLAHFLSVSGLHLGSIAGLVFFAIRFLLVLFPFIALRFDVKKIAAIVAILFSALYLLLSGMAIPAQRAFIMTSVVLIGVIFNRQAISLRMVSLAALTILVISPQALVSVSFQMSFSAVYALVAFYETYAGKLAEMRRSRRVLSIIFWYLAGIVICDFVASLATAPFALYHFHRLAVYTSLGNLLAGSLIAFWLMPAILLCLAALPFGLAFYPLKFLGLGIEVLNKITAFVAALPDSVWQNDALSFSAFMLMVCGGYWICVWRGSWRRWGVIPVVIGLLSFFMSMQKPDIVFSPYAAQIAVRDNNGKLVMLPLQKDNWLQQIWQEALEVQVPDKDMQRDILSAMRGQGQMPEYLPLVCQEDKCVYRERVVLLPTKIIADGWEIDVAAGGYIYLGQEIDWYPLWRRNNRLWHGKFEQNEEE